MICSNLLQTDSSGTFTANIPAGRLCYWQFSFLQAISNYTSLKAFASNEIYLLLNTFTSNEILNTTQDFDLSENGDIELLVVGFYFEVFVLSLASNATSVTISWNLESSTTLLGTTNIVILCTGLAMIIVLFCLCCCLFKSIKKSRSRRIAQDIAYQYIPAESSVSGFLQMHLPIKIYIDDHNEETCCICFDM